MNKLARMISVLFFIFWTTHLMFASCSNVQQQKQQQQPDNTKPMYGEVAKSASYKKSDEDFKKQCLEYFGTIDNAVEAHIEFAWEYFCQNDLNTAMKRLNQAWLLNPEYPDTYFGFAAIMEMKDNKSEAERFYKMGHEKDTTKERAEICYQRIESCKELLKNK